MLSPLFAKADMQGNLIAAGVVLVLGILGLRLLRPAAEDRARASARSCPQAITLAIMAS